MPALRLLVPGGTGRDRVRLRLRQRVRARGRGARAVAASAGAAAAGAGGGARLRRRRARARPGCSNALQYFWRGAVAALVALATRACWSPTSDWSAPRIDARALWVLPLGIAWSLAGAAVAARRGDRIGGAWAALPAKSSSDMLQLGVNTVSFVRVGAFALAHAGLCTAVVGMAEAAGPGLLAGPDPRQRRNHRARRPRRQHPDDAPRAVRVLHPLPDGARPTVRAAARRRRLPRFPEASHETRPHAGSSPSPR